MKLWGWGANTTGQLNLGFCSEQVSLPTEVPLLRIFDADADDVSNVNVNVEKAQEFIQIHGGGSHTAVLINGSGLVYSTTLLGLISTKKPCPKNQVLAKPVSQAVTLPKIPETLVSGWDFSLFLNSAGEVYSLGDNSYGQLGRRVENGVKFCPTWDKVLLPCKVASISAGMRHAAAVDVNGCIYSWGDNSKAQTGLGLDFKVIPEPMPIEKGDNQLPRPRRIRCSKMCTIFLSDTGRFYGAGLNKFGILGTQANPKENLVPEFVKLFSDEESEKLFPDGSILDFQCGWNHLLVLLTDGRVLSWGRNNFRQLGRDVPAGVDVDYDLKPDFVQGLPEPITSISTGSEHNLVLGKSGQVYSWGWNEHDNCGVSQVPDSEHVIPCPTRVPIPETEKVIVIGCGAGNSFAVTASRQ